MGIDREIIGTFEALAKHYLDEGKTRLQIERAFNIAHKEIINRLKHNIATDEHGEAKTWLEEITSEPLVKVGQRVKIAYMNSPLWGDVTELKLTTDGWCAKVEFTRSKGWYSDKDLRILED